MKNLVEEIQHLQTKPGDVVFFKMKEGTTPEEANGLAEYIRERAGDYLEGVTVLFGHNQSMVEVIDTMPEGAMNEIGWFRSGDPEQN